MRSKKILFAGFATLDIIKDKKYLGGAAGAMSVNACSLGLDSYLLTVLANDKLGKFYTQSLKEKGVNVELCIFNAPSIPTCKIDNPHVSGSKRIWKDNGSLIFFKKLKLNKNKLNSFDAIYIVNAMPYFAEKIASTANIKNIFYIPGPQAVLKKDYVRKSILTRSRIVFGNSEEEPYIFKKKPFNYNVEIVVITRGKYGGDVYLANGRKITFTAPKIRKAIDPTGAGDAFALGFGISIIKTVLIDRAIENGKKLAKKTILQKGSVWLTSSKLEELE